jgi:Cu/Ag efflux protein CusF
VDKEAGKITLKHEAIPNLEMPAMTMVFRGSDPKLLEQVQSGDKVRVAVEKVGGQFTVTKIEQTP